MKHLPTFKWKWSIVMLLSMFLTVGATAIDHPLSLAPVAQLPNAQLSPTLSLSPSTGSANLPITAIGEGWFPGTQVTVAVLDGIIKYGVGGAKVDEDGRFLINFFMPTHMRTRPLIIVQARTVVGTIEGEAMAEAGFGPTPAATIENSEATTTAETAASAPNATEASGEMTMTAEERALCEAQQAAANMSFPQIPALTTVPAVARVCHPSEWSGCGGASCAAEYVSQCQPDGTWGECVWDPGFCGEDDDDDDDDDEDDN